MLMLLHPVLNGHNEDEFGQFDSWVFSLRMDFNLIAFGFVDSDSHWKRMHNRNKTTKTEMKCNWNATIKKNWIWNETKIKMDIMLVSMNWNTKTHWCFFYTQHCFHVISSTVLLPPATTISISISTCLHSGGDPWNSVLTPCSSQRSQMKTLFFDFCAFTSSALHTATIRHFFIKYSSLLATPTIENFPFRFVQWLN